MVALESRWSHALVATQGDDVQSGSVASRAQAALRAAAPRKEEETALPVAGPASGLAAICRFDAVWTHCGTPLEGENGEAAAEAGQHCTCPSAFCGGRLAAR
jgi:hypothetical protein